MKKVILLTSLFIGLTSFAGTTHVNGYVRKDGTYVQPHFRTTPNDSLLDNYSTKGNINPYTGKEGTVYPYSTTTNSSWKNNSNNLNNSLFDE